MALRWPRNDFRSNGYSNVISEPVDKNETKCFGRFVRNLQIDISEQI